ncbi:Maturation and nuclear export of 40S ribosomal subunits interacting protein, partial [Dimargaris verticillata]
MVRIAIRQEDTLAQDIALNVFRVLDALHNLPTPASEMTEYWAVNPNDYTLARPSKKARTQDKAATSRSTERCTVPYEHCVQFESCWLGLLKQPLTLEMYKHILLRLHKHVIPHMAHPPSLLNFLVHIYDQGGVISVLALSSLFTLIQHHNLNYPDFYAKLYTLFDRNMFHVKYRSRFCRLAIKFLSSTKLSAHLIAAFIKRMA